MRAALLYLSVLTVASCSALQPAFAQQKPNLVRTPTPSGWEYTQPSGPNLSGTPQPLQPTKPPNWGSGAAPAGSHYRATANGFEAGGTFRQPVPGAAGKTIDVSAKWPISRPAMGKAIGRMLPIIGWGAAAYGFYDLLDELGYFKGEDGTLRKNAQPIGGAYKVPSTDPNSDVAYMYATWSAACASTYGPGCSVWVKPVPSGSGDYCNGYKSGPGTCFAMQGPLAAVFGGYTTAYLWRPTQIFSPPSVAATQQELEDAIANYENPSILNPALEDVTNHPQWEHPSSTSNPTLSGPSSTPGGSKQTNHPDGKVSTSTTTINHTYNQNKTYHTTTTVTNIFNPTTGTTETTTEESEESPPEDEPAVDTPLSDLPKLYEKKYPDGFAGAWNARKTELLGAPIGSLISSLMPNISGAGTCPSWPIDLTIGPWMMGTFDVAPPCMIWDFAKVIVIISALLLARSLIFGG